MLKSGEQSGPPEPIITDLERTWGAFGLGILFLDELLIPECVLLRLFMELLDILTDRTDFSLPDDFKGLY